MSEEKKILIDLKGIEKSYQIGEQCQRVLHGVDLQITQGELVSIMGQSGSGKTTLMNLVGLLDIPDAGSYHFVGDEVSHLSKNELAAIRNQKMGFVFQSFFLLPRMTALQNVCLPLMYAGVNAIESEARAKEMLDVVGLDQWFHHKPAELSGGQQQRVAIARALINQPAVVLADEPTGALDPRIGQDILELFIHLNEKNKTTLLMITHDPNVANACTRRLKMTEGHLETR